MEEMAFLEKDFQTHFNKWCKHLFDETGVFELKLTKGTSIPFSSVVEHQENALSSANIGSIVFKIPDCGFQNPFDSIMVKHVSAFVVVMFRAKQQEFIMIPIKTWLSEKQFSARKSLTEERAKIIGLVCNLKGDKSFKTICHDTSPLFQKPLMNGSLYSIKR